MRKMSAIAVLLLCFCSVPDAWSQTKGDEIAKKFMNNVVQITVKFADKSDSGIGFAVGQRDDKVYMVTARHVVRSESKANIGVIPEIRVRFNDDKGNLYNANLLDVRSEYDLALIEVSKPSMKDTWGKDCCDASAERGSEVWFIGEDWYVPTISGRIAQAPSFENRHKHKVENLVSVRVGTSGAPLFTEKGIAGMIIEHDSDSKMTYALDIKVIKEAVEKANYPWQSVQNPSPRKATYKLRSEPITVSTEKASEVFEMKTNEKDWWIPLKYIENIFNDNGDGTITDWSTGLMWQKSGSGNSLTHENAKAYIRELNAKKIAGYEDWRLPTVDELRSLLMPKKTNGDLYIVPLFDKTQRYCWTSDQRTSGGAWDVYFNFGDVHWDDDAVYVRAVRSIQ
jgi:hypothetical protein